MLYTPHICNDLFSRLINLKVNVHQLLRTTFPSKNIENIKHVNQSTFQTIRTLHTVQTQLSNQVPASRGHYEVTDCRPDARMYVSQTAFWI